MSIDESKIDLDAGPNVGPLSLEVWPRSSLPIREAEWLTLTGRADSEEEAKRTGTLTAHALHRAFARLRVAADFGERAATGRWTEYGKQLIQDPEGRPVLDDEHGLMVFPTEPRPRFMGAGPASLKLSAQRDRLVLALRAALEAPEPLTDQDRIAYDIFSAAFFETSPDSRLILLVMAIETLLTPARRSDAVQRHVDGLIAATKSADDLGDSERQSMVRSLDQLRKQSITAAGSALVESRLGGREYAGESANRLWKRAYGLRSKLVHGASPRPTRDEVGRCAAALELMVSHLLSGRLFDVTV